MTVGDAEQLEIQQEDKLSDKCQTFFWGTFKPLSYFCNHQTFKATVYP